MILVVDDEQTIVNLLSVALKKEGYRVEGAANGVEAYKRVKDPDCKGMLLDINMPKINGIELLMLMQADGLEVPTIVMAGFDDYDENEMKGFSNVVKYLHKPFALEDMLDAIKGFALPAGRD